MIFLGCRFFGCKHVAGYMRGVYFSPVVVVVVVQKGLGFYASVSTILFHPQNGHVWSKDFP